MTKSRINLFFLALFIISGNAYAWQCTILYNQFNVMLPSNIDVQRDIANGQALTGWITGAGLQNVYRCNTENAGGPEYAIRETTPAQDTGLVYNEGIPYKIYKTSIDGVGFIARARSRGAGSLSNYYEFPYGQWVNGYYAEPLTIQFEVEIKLIKIDNINGGVIDSFEVGRLNAYGRNAPSVNYYPIRIITSTSKINVLACSVNTPVVNVIFDKYQTAYFKRVGTSTPTTPFNIGLTCNSQTRINLKMNANKDNELDLDGLIKLQDGSDAATGVAVQVLDKNDNPISINKNIYFGVSESDGMFNLNLNARYVQTLDKVKSGKANAVATFTLTYN